MKSLPDIQTGYHPLSNLLYQSYLPAIINSALEAGLFQALHKTEKNIDQLCETIHTDTGITQALCEVLIAVELLEFKKKNFRLAKISEEFLVEESPVNQILDVKKYSGSPGPFDNLLDALKGEQQEFNHKRWADEKMVLQMEQGAKAGSIQNIISFVTSLPEFQSMRKMCDLAGSIGHYSAAICEENTNLHAHVYDLPEVTSIAPKLRKETSAGRIRFHDCDIRQDPDFGRGYDLFFVSHFLYGHGADNSLVPFLRKVNRAVTNGGIFVSHHIADVTDSHMQIPMKIVELMTKAMGYPTHKLPLDILTNALAETGFGQFTIKGPDQTLPFPTTLVAARKEANVQE